MLKTTVFSLALLSLVAAARADDFESRVTEFKLANGLPVLVYTDSSAPVVTVAVAYKVGSNYEPPGKTGPGNVPPRRSPPQQASGRFDQACT